MADQGAIGANDLYSPFEYVVYLNGDGNATTISAAFLEYVGYPPSDSAVVADLPAVFEAFIFNDEFWVLGNISASIPARYRTNKLPTWDTNPLRSYIGNVNVVRDVIDNTKVLHGTITEEGTPVAGRMVRLYYRSSGRLIAQCQSSQNGKFFFEGLEVGTDLYYVIALDDELSPSFNLEVYDRVVATTIPAAVPDALQFQDVEPDNGNNVQLQFTE